MFVLSCVLQKRHWDKDPEGGRHSWHQSWFRDNTTLLNRIFENYTKYGEEYVSVAHIRITEVVTMLTCVMLV